MRLSQLQNKKIAFLGLGVENFALIKFLLKHRVNCEMTICDKRNQNELIERFKDSKIQRLDWKSESRYNKALDRFDILFRSPGMPLFDKGIKQAVLAKSISNQQSAISNFIYSPMKLFFDLCPTKKIIGVTGTKGKGTTSSLIYEILREAAKDKKKFKVFLGGNIGIAPFDFIDKIKKEDRIVLELSSFQLEDLHKSPHIAVITNFYNEHLAPADPNNPNYHKTEDDYWNAKSNIFLNQKRGDKAIFNLSLQDKASYLKKKIKSNFYFFGQNKSANSFFLDEIRFQLLTSNFLLPTSLPGPHNRENIAAAALAAKFAGANIANIRLAVEKFKGLEHRIEKVASLDNVEYYNDSFATTPESAITALRSFSSPIILLAGGAEKKSDFKKLAQEIKIKTRFVILLAGKATPRLKAELLKIHYPLNRIYSTDQIDDAVRRAWHESTAGDIVLLSTACASFGMFKNYKERGKKFKASVLELKSINKQI